MIFFPLGKTLHTPVFGPFSVYITSNRIVEMYKYMLSHNLLENFLEVPVMSQIWGHRQCGFPGGFANQDVNIPKVPAVDDNFRSTSWI